jgi:hypothetical protein
MTQTFSQTCNKPYNKHHYKLVDIDGNEVTFDNYEDVQLTWWNTPSGFLSHIEVLDIPQKKSKGFK